MGDVGLGGAQQRQTGPRTSSEFARGAEIVERVSGMSNEPRKAVGESRSAV